MLISAFRLAFTLIFTGIAIQLCAQQTPSSATWYLEVPGLNVERYANLHHALEGHQRYALSEACVPAGVLAISLKPGQIASANELDQIVQIMGAKGFPNTVEMDNASPESFFERCRAARFGSN